MHIQSLEEARAASRTGPVELFSFDVFDTFLLRRCTSPDGVFERAFALAPIPAGHRGMVEAFVQQRQLAEGKARKAGKTANGSPEVTIEEIYRLFPTRVFGLPADAWPLLVEAEFQAELELCFANPQVAELQREMKAAGLRTGFLSDTYWSAPRLGRLLKACAPDLEWDFLYASCDHRSGKGEKLFERALSDLAVAPDCAAHLGDNDFADIIPARRLGIRAVRYPQASPEVAAVFQRESALFALACQHNGASRRLDGAARTLRRAVIARAPAGGPAFDYGVRILGPVLAAFDRFVADRVERLERSGAKVAVAFLARDGLAPLMVWQALHQHPAAYVEINRRIALIAGSRSLDPVVEFFRQVPMVNRRVVTQFFKAEPPRMARYFRQLKGGAVSGKTFAAELPQLLGEDDLAQLSTRLRQGLLAHLRATIADFDTVTDLVLVDLGYSGTVQKALRTVLEAEGLPQRLHGLYVLSADECFHDIAESDSAEGMLSDAVMVPHAKRAMLSNVAILEQLCSAAEGSVQSYHADGTVSREDDPRALEQLELCEMVRRGAVHYAASAAALNGFPDAPGDPAAAVWAGAVLARALLLPTDDELVLLGALRHDINLGSQALAPMADAEAAAAIAGAKALPAAFAPHEPPMWMAGSMAALSPLHGFLYALNGTGGLPADVAGDLPCGSTEVALIDGSNGHPLTVTCLRTGFGDIRLRVPVLRNGGITAIAIPAGALPGRGVVRAVTLQSDDTTARAMANPHIRAIPVHQIQALGMALGRGIFESTGGDGHLIVPVPPLDAAVGVVTLTVSPLDGGRVLALADQT